MMRKNQQKPPSPYTKTKHLLQQENTNLPYVQLNLSTWLKDSHGLYDYEAPQAKCEKEVINVSKSSHIYRHTPSLKTFVVDINSQQDVPLGSIHICTLFVDRESNIFTLKSSSQQSANMNGQKIFTVVRSCQNSDLDGYSLRPGNIIRLGRVEYLVLEIRNSQQTKTLSHSNHLQLNKRQFKVKQKLKGQCKICLSEDDYDFNPFLNPCNCKGSCELVHLSCLKTWIDSKVKKEINGVVCSYNFSRFECEICKTELPKTIQLQNQQKVEVITIQKPTQPYMVLETLGRQEKKERIVHLIYGNPGQTMKVGRGHQCELRVNDISVSRMHADVRFEQDKFIVKDKQSKFGTLVKFDDEMPIKEESQLQCGRLLLEFKIKKKNNEEIDTNSDDDS